MNPPRPLRHGIAKALNKPEQYMMVSLEADRPMMFAGTSEPTGD